MGVALARNGDYDEAIEIFTQVLKSEPNNVANWCNLAQVQRKVGLLDEAAKSALAALRLDNRHLGTLQLYAVLSKELNFEEGFRIAQTALEESQALDLCPEWN